jgi:hypothetical protein
VDCIPLIQLFSRWGGPLGVLEGFLDKGSIPTLASSSNCVRSNELGVGGSRTDTGTDTKFGAPPEIRLTGGNSPVTL